MNRYKMVELGTLIHQAKTVRCGDGDYPVLSMTMHDGLVFQDDKFKKAIASKDKSDYKVVKRNQLVISFPIDEGVLATQRIVDAGIVSPAYGIWDINQERVLPEFLEYALRCDRALNYYKAKLRGSTARRRSLPTPTLLAFTIPLPGISEQQHILEVIRKVKSLISCRTEEITELDNLIKARFVEMFGDPLSNPLNWRRDKADNHIDLLSGFPFDSSKYTEDGIKICGGLIIMPQRIDWNSCKHWRSVDGYENYTLQANDIVMALDRPWISEGFKIAMVNAEHLPALLIQRTARIRATDINQHYLMYYFLIGGFDKHCSITGSLVPHISAKDIRSYPIMLPPLPLQESFAAFVEQVDKSKVVVQKALNEAQTLFDSLMQEYFG